MLSRFVKYIKLKIFSLSRSQLKFFRVSLLKELCKTDLCKKVSYEKFQISYDPKKDMTAKTNLIASDIVVDAITVPSHESNSWFRRRPSCEIGDGTRACLCDCATPWLPWASFHPGFDHANPPFVGSVAHTSTRLQESSVIVKSVTAGRLQAGSVSSTRVEDASNRSFRAS